MLSILICYVVQVQVQVQRFDLFSLKQNFGIDVRDVYMSVHTVCMIGWGR